MQKTKWTTKWVLASAMIWMVSSLVTWSVPHQAMAASFSSFASTGLGGVPPLNPSGNPAVLDPHRRMALGMIETGNHDGEIGGRGEVSRYQIMPSVWRKYSSSMNYRNPEISLEVAQKHWGRLYSQFVRETHRQPTDFDMYVLWNTHYGYYASRGFNPNRLCASVRDRAQRYVNLVQSDDF